MKTKTLLSIAIMAALPLNVMAANISGAMYTAPSAANNDHPAPTTQAAAPFGRIDIDTADQEHIATTAYVKGAYNSAIAAVNKVNSEKQGQLLTMDDSEIIQRFVRGYIGDALVDYVFGDEEDREAFLRKDEFRKSLASEQAVAMGIADVVDNQRVTVYTTWDNDNATMPVKLSHDW